MTTITIPELNSRPDALAADRLLHPSDDTDWQQLLAYLPPDLDTSARRYGALRRKRQIPSAAIQLRLILAYACGHSLDTLAARATELGLVEHIGDNALHERFERLVPWLSYLVGQQLAGAAATFPWGVALRIRLLDATTLARPGACPARIGACTWAWICAPA
ncbi:MAG: hypothetical protein ACYC6A_20700 [Armatimonadota bacterium]